jgi:hypothetical protein
VWDWETLRPKRTENTHASRNECQQHPGDPRPAGVRRGNAHPEQAESQEQHGDAPQNAP